MLNNLNKIIPRKIRGFINHTNFSKEDGLSYWRERILNALLMVLLVFGTLAVVPNLIASIKSNTHLITAVDLLVYICLIVLIAYNKLSLKTKTIIIITFIYLLSIVLLYTLGPYGPGFVWLACTSLIAALLLGLRASLITIGINVAIIVVTAALIYYGVFHTMFFESYTTITWIAVSTNVIIFNSITSIPVASLLEALERSMNNEKALKQQLIVRNKEVEKEKDMAVESDQSKSAFLANLSHEVRTPMNAIIGFTDLIRAKVKSDPQLVKYNDIVIQNSHYLLALINDILDISIIESGKLRLNFQTVKMTEVMNDVQVALQASKEYKLNPECKIHFKIKAEIKQKEVKTDPIRLKQILINLISNGIKYSPAGTINVSTYLNDEKMEFKIEDNGVGIPESEQEKIFRRFSKIDHKDYDYKASVGLGLSISKGLCHALGGDIWFESKEGVGTTFFFNLPIQ